MPHAQAIDRRALVERHHVVVDAIDTALALAVGNGEFAFGADITGLQTFADDWRVPLATLAQWAWHSEPNPAGHTLADAMQPWRFGQRTVPLPTAGWPAEPGHAAAAWLERNPHKFNLGRVALHLCHADRSPARLADLRSVQQTLQLWTGTLRSRFSFDGHRIAVTTQVHATQDLLSIQVTAPAALRGRIGIALFPQAAVRAAGPGSAATPPQRDSVVCTRTGAWSLHWLRQMDDTVCHIDAQGDQALACEQAGVGWRISAADGDGDGDADADARSADASLALTLRFGAAPGSALLPTTVQTADAVQAHWQAFWQQGGAIDFQACTDPRANELERRVVLSQYLMAVHAAGSLPPQETGLAELSWHGKFHLEMHAWHASHFALWGRAGLLERSMGWYLGQLGNARERAAAQGLAGARWPKMTGPEGRESPGAINPLIVWQQPHPIHLAELLRRASPADEDALLVRYAELVFDSADCIASMAVRDAQGRFAIGPPVVPVQEIHDAAATFNPAFELAYFRHGLRTAQRWRQRLKLPRRALWDTVADGLAPLPQHAGLYLVAESQPALWQRAACDDCRDTGEALALDDLLRNRCPNVDHPSFAGAIGWLPGEGVDVEVMRRTLFQVRAAWNLSKVWGWDFGMLAMCAARLGEPALAIDFLLHGSVANRWGRDGRVAWKAINAYLPANGALLSAVALMAAGWDGCDTQHPGFAASDGWQISAEGLLPSP